MNVLCVVIFSRLNHCSSNQGSGYQWKKKCLKKCHCWTSDTTYNVRGQKQDWLVCSLNHHMIIREVCNNTPLSMLPLHCQRSKNLTPLKAKMTKFTILQCTMCLSESMKCLFHTLKKNHSHSMLSNLFALEMRDTNI